MRIRKKDAGVVKDIDADDNDYGVRGINHPQMYLEISMQINLK